MQDVTQEWPNTLDTSALISSGWQPEPFQEFVLKIHSRCDLACDYCYMYTMADQDWRNQPVRMSPGTIDKTVARIAQHARSHRLKHLRVILHGGEPLLAGPTALRRVVRQLSIRLPPETSALVSLQTSGIHLTDTNLRLLDELGIQVGVSLDGIASDHDRHRRRRDGNGSHADVIAGLKRLNETNYRHLYRGILCTIDLRNDALATYKALRDLNPPAIDFLLPHANWSSPPPGHKSRSRPTPYADWLIKIFDYWYNNPVQEVHIRFFEEIMHGILGGSSRIDGIGLTPIPIAIIETDGTIQQSDFLKSAYHGAAFTGLHVDDDSFDTAFLLPAIAVRQLGATALSATCRICRIHRICGGGQYVHRYRIGEGFANPSVYCADLYALIRHIHHNLATDLERVLRPC
jgi:uncharacterized protein